MKYRLLLTIALVFGAIGCSVNDQVEEQGESLSIVFTAAPFQDGDRGIDTRTSVIPNETYTSYAFVWSAKDTVGIYPDSGSQIYFTMSNGEGVGTTSFDGGAWTCKEGHSFRSYYPFIGNFYLDETKIPVTFIGQKQVGNDNSDHFQKYDYMYTAVTTKDSGFLNFNYNHLITGVLPWVELPAGHYTGLTLSLDEALFVTKGEYDLTADSPAIVGKEYSNTMSIDLDVTFTSPDILKVYVPLAPMDMSGKTLTITITDENGREFQYTYNPSKRYEASKIYRLRSATSFVDDIINFADPAVKAICVENWDANGDGELSYDEAASVTIIPSGVFTNNQDITTFEELVYFTNITSFEPDAFNGCSELRRIVIPSNVEEIGLRSFKGCQNITSINIPDNVKTIGYQAFMDCTELSSLVLPNSVTKIDYSTFEGCSALKSIVIPSGVTSIGNRAFAGCQSLTSVVFPEVVYTIGKDAFSLCIELSSVILNDVTSIGDYAFDACVKLTNISISDKLVSIGNYAFIGCNSLQTFVIPESVQTIGTYAFGSGQTIIIIPGIGPDGIVPASCSSLQSVFVHATIPPTLGRYALSYSNDCPIFVPAGSVDVYKTAGGWSDYADRIFAIPGSAVPEAIDLGSGVGGKWASFNIGANSPEEIGIPFAWGEIETKSEFGWDNYMWYKDGGICKYYNYANQGGISWTGEGERGDDIIVLESSDDAATAIWGEDWRMPTKHEIQLLLENCDWVWTQLNNVWGYQVKSRTNDNSIFLPAIGTESTSYWTSSYYFDNMPPVQDNAAHAYCLVIRDGYMNQSHNARDLGFYIRPIHR